MSSIDAMTRRAMSLRDADETTGMVQINSSLAHRLNISDEDTVVVEQEENSVSAPVMINDAISDNCVLIQVTQLNHFELGAWHANVSLRKA
jgi:anaerobic selenocysteine-containing dehydrogenase